MMRKLSLIGLFLFALLGLGPAVAQQPLTFQITGPAGSLPIVVSTTGTTTSITATLTGVSGKYTYLCGFVVTSAGTTTAASGTITITGVPNTMNFIYTFVSSGQGVLGVALGPGCIASSAQNTNIVITVPAGGAGTSVAVSAWGYTL